MLACWFEFHDAFVKHSFRVGSTFGRVRSHPLLLYIQILHFIIHQRIVGCTPTNVPLWEIPEKCHIWWIFMGYNPQGFQENTINYHGYIVRGTPDRPLNPLGGTKILQGSAPFQDSAGAFVPRKLSRSSRISNLAPWKGCQRREHGIYCTHTRASGK